jgi:hypothetical protein
VNPEPSPSSSTLLRNLSYLKLESPLDVLEVFTRINRAAVQVAGRSHDSLRAPCGPIARSA